MTLIELRDECNKLIDQLHGDLPVCSLIYPLGWKEVNGLHFATPLDVASK